MSKPKSNTTITVGDKTAQQLHQMVTQAFKALGLRGPRFYNVKNEKGVRLPDEPLSDQDFWTRLEAIHVKKHRAGERTQVGQIAAALRRDDTLTNGVESLAEAVELKALGINVDVKEPTKQEIKAAKQAGEPRPVTTIGFGKYTADGKMQGCTLDQARAHIAAQVKSGELTFAVHPKTGKPQLFHGVHYATQHINHVCKVAECPHPAEERKAYNKAVDEAVEAFLARRSTKPVQVRTGKVVDGREQVIETSLAGQELKDALAQGYYGKKLFGGFTWKAQGVEHQSKLGTALVCRAIESAEKHWGRRYGGSWASATEKHRGKLSTYAKNPLTRWTYHVASERWVPDTCYDAYDEAYTAEKAKAKADAKARRARDREGIERLADDFGLPYSLAKAAYNDHALPTDEAIAKALHELHGIPLEDALDVVDLVLDEQTPVAEALERVMGSAPAEEPPSQSESDTDSEPEEEPAPAPEPTPPPAAAAAPKKPDDTVEAALAAIAEEERALAEKKAKLRAQAADQGESTAEKKRKRTRRGGKKNGKGKKAPAEKARAEKKPTVPKPAAKQGGKSKSPGKSPAAKPPAPVEQPKKPPQAAWVRKPEHAAADAALAESGATFGEARKAPVTLVAQKKRRRPRKKPQHPAKKGVGGPGKTPKQPQPDEKGVAPAEEPQPQPDEKGAAGPADGWGTESEDEDVPDWAARFARPGPATRSTKPVQVASTAADDESSDDDWEQMAAEEPGSQRKGVVVVSRSDAKALEC
jgi:hypothetical protein